MGIVLAKDLYTAVLNGDQSPWTSLEGFCREPLLVPESQKIAQLFDSMRTHRAHMALVMDEYGGLAGIVTLEDLLEEIVGEIHDETDLEAEAVVLEELGDGRWRADGLLSLADVERAIGLEVSDELDANTLSGLFMHHLLRMPEAGDAVAEGGFRLTVESVADNRVGQILIERIVVDDEADAAAETD
jgi:CBS domain containing-hemolysin-like protein